MKRLLIVSNRLPVSIEKGKGSLDYKQSVGGLATAVGSFYREYSSLWIGWPGITSDKITKGEREEIARSLANTYKSHPVFLSQKALERFYYGFSNKTLWPLFHYFPLNTVYDEEFWKDYIKVNADFCTAVTEVARPGDVVWIHDYHLLLLPRMIKEQLPDTSIGFFLHIPFPSFELFRLLPWRKEILNGMLGADLVGFHTYEYAQHFMKSCHRLLGHEFNLGQTVVEDRIVKADIFPIGIDYEKFSETAARNEVIKEAAGFRKKVSDRKIILSVDRLDYSKGLLKRLEAIEIFLKKYPEYREKVVFIQITVPSRERVEHYKILKSQIDTMVGKINGQYGTIGRVPVWYLYRSLTFSRLVALYQVSDIALITPLRDGMNLVAKEYIATKRDKKGVLILSEMAGAAAELGEALIVNPNDTLDVASKIKAALDMGDEDKVSLIGSMQKRISYYNVKRWAADFISVLDKTKQQQKLMSMQEMNDRVKSKLLSDYTRAEHRLFLLDYDGTLVPFADKPEDAAPSPAVRLVLEKLSSDTRNSVIVISGRDRETLEKWFSDASVGLVAEHGVWLKERGAESWTMVEPLSNEWKKDLRPILEYYVNRTPGSFIEEKSYSLVWHYRKVEPDLGQRRARELVDETTQLTSNLDLQILEGNKVIEIKNQGVNKGRAARHWIARRKWDFALAVGDDVTDEDMFLVLPPNGCSIKVGLRPSRAKYNMERSQDVLLLLTAFESEDSNSRKTRYDIRERKPYEKGLHFLKDQTKKLR
ncbi:MAG: bifunctional alpha,alpha-trehalose-phosphate synthase (UDP-forming)/trehalose-phosphatase [Candidatus Dadabacteria bacterium]|nr:bifunctional alpha,alpha-trehalose-phosphate synthase (UDP-forming)/trehalose-phosphatase [Candidatus Dadabacteria bacterium]